MNTNPKSEYYSKSYYRKVREASQEQLRRKEARFKRQEKHRREVDKAFADFCEATDGEAYNYVNNGVCSFEIHDIRVVPRSVICYCLIFLLK